MSQFLLQIFLMAVYLMAHMMIVFIAVGIGLWLQGSVEWLIGKTNASPTQIDEQFRNH
jgi:hypothetical protein